MYRLLSSVKSILRYSELKEPDAQIPNAPPLPIKVQVPDRTGKLYIRGFGRERYTIVFKNCIDSTAVKKELQRQIKEQTGATVYADNILLAFDSVPDRKICRPTELFINSADLFMVIKPMTCNQNHENCDHKESGCNAEAS